MIKKFSKNNNYKDQPFHVIFFKHHLIFGEFRIITSKTIKK